VFGEVVQGMDVVDKIVAVQTTDKGPNENVPIKSVIMTKVREIGGAPAPAPKPAGEHKPGSQPNRQLFRRSTYAGVKDTGPVAGETFEQKVARLKAVSAGAKQRAEEGGEAPSAAAVTEVLTSLAPDQEVPPPAAAPAAPASASAPAHKPTGNADRSLMKRSTYCGVVDTGPVPGETFEQKVARLAAVSAAAKQRSEGG